MNISLWTLIWEKCKYFPEALEWTWVPPPQGLLYLLDSYSSGFALIELAFLNTALTLPITHTCQWFLHCMDFESKGQRESEHFRHPRMSWKGFTHLPNVIPPTAPQHHFHIHLPLISIWAVEPLINTYLSKCPCMILGINRLACSRCPIKLVWLKKNRLCGWEENGLHGTISDCCPVSNSLEIRI